MFIVSTTQINIFGGRVPLIGYYELRVRTPQLRVLEGNSQGVRQGKRGTEAGEVFEVSPRQ